MDCSSNQDNLWWRDCDGQCQQQWEMVVQWAAGQQSDCNGQWDGSGMMDGAMGSKQLPPKQKWQNGR